MAKNSVSPRRSDRTQSERYVPSPAGTTTLGIGGLHLRAHARTVSVHTSRLHHDPKQVYVGGLLETVPRPSVGADGKNGRPRRIRPRADLPIQRVTGTPGFITHPQPLMLAQLCHQLIHRLRQIRNHSPTREFPTFLGERNRNRLCLPIRSLTRALRIGSRLFHDD